MVELEIDVETTPAEAARLAVRLEESLGLRIKVQSTPGGSLPRAEMKSKRWERTA